jgi:poly(3-hydroxybutyrate) depolymerase
MARRKWPVTLQAAGSSRRRHVAAALRALAWAATLACGAAANAAAALPEARIDPRQVTVSGVSAGGFMAVQLHVAHSDVFSGVGAVAAGPFLCAEASLVNARMRCMKTVLSMPVARLVRRTRELAQARMIAPVGGMADARVFLFAGEKDDVVAPAVVRSLAAYYSEFVTGPGVVLRRHPQAGHGMVTQGAGGPCSASAAPYLNDCGLDLAGEMLSHLIPGLSAPGRPALDAHLLAFDQTPFRLSPALDDSGWIYLPAACRAGGNGPPCRLHVALHGCRQSTREVGQRFVREAGYNRWAEQNGIVVLYPQTGKAPNGCWDWWGYEGPAYASRQGAQVQSIRRMVERLVAPEGRR